MFSFTQKARQRARRSHVAVRRAKARAYQPLPEPLEGRCCPSFLFVTNASDTGAPGDGSLRGEIADAHSGDTVRFLDSLDGQTITLTHGPLQIEESLKIIGSDANPVKINANHASRVFEIRFDPDRELVVTLAGLGILNGFTDELDGGGILNQVDLTMSHCIVAGGVSNDLGGGIANNGTLTVENCNFFENSATAGGAIYSNGPLTIRDSLIWGNSVRTEGGGILSDSKLALHNTSVYQNNAETGGGIFSFGTLSLLHSNITNNAARGRYAGGVANFGSALIRDHSQLVANTASIGADLYSPGEYLRDGTSIIGVIFPLPTRPRLHHRK